MASWAARYGETSLLYRLVEMRSNYQHINVNKLLCEKLLDDAPDKRRFIGGTYLADILRPKANDAWLVDNIEVLFSNELKLSIVDSLKALGQENMKTAGSSMELVVI